MSVNLNALKGECVLLETFRHLVVTLEETRLLRIDLFSYCCFFKSVRDPLLQLHYFYYRQHKSLS